PVPFHFAPGVEVRPQGFPWAFRDSPKKGYGAASHCRYPLRPLHWIRLFHPWNHRPWGNPNLFRTLQVHPGPVPRSGNPHFGAVPFPSWAPRNRPDRLCPLPFHLHLESHFQSWADPHALQVAPRRTRFPILIGPPKPLQFVPIIALYPLQLAEVLDPCPASVVPLTDDPS